MQKLGQLEEIYNQFCAFGSRHDMTSDKMTNQKWNKFCKDHQKVFGNGVTGTDTDIIFNKCKSKSDRVLDFPKFCDCLKEVALLKYKQKSKEEAFDSLVIDICKAASGPQINKEATKASADSITQRLTDASQYTGTHKNRFGEDGKGLGKSGRTDKVEGGVLAMDQITNRKEADKRGVQIGRS